eukprot:scaffold136764_cov401-Phaeocystis_antarctica.AAC.1
MYCMFVTLDVSKLSDWLNAYAFCRVERRAYDAGQGVGGEAGGRGATTTQAACTGRAPQKAGGQGTRGAHPKHLVHARDA